MKVTIGISILMIVVISGFVSHAFAQEAPAPPPKPWEHNLAGALALTQIRLKDWAKGGEDALSWVLSAEGKSVNNLSSAEWATTYKLAFGQTKLGEGAVRKTDDKIDLETLFTYRLGIYVNPYAAATLKTQFAKGFEYDADGNGTEVSKFFDPAYLTQSAGLGYEPVPQVKTRLGLAVREILTDEFNRFSDDPETEEIEKTKVDGGVESVTEVNWEFQKNILFTSKLEIFSAFKTFTDAAVRNDSNLAIKVNKYVTVNLNTQLISDTTASPKVQFKETLSLGLSYTLF